MKKRLMDLQLFSVEGPEGPTSQSAGNGAGADGQGTANTGVAAYTYEQLEEIATSRAGKAERAAIATYLRKQGMSEDDITVAINDFKEKQRANQPDATKLQKERDDALGQLAQYENEKLLTGKGVKADDLDYVSFKVNQLVTDKKDFKTAAAEFLKANPKFTGQTYKVSTGVSAGSASGGGTETKNEQINNMIRGAFGR